MSLSHILSLDLNLLVMCAALLEEQNVTRAAARLGRTQSAVSRALARLRDQFDDELLVRSGNKMVMTPLAEQLAPRVRELLMDAESVLRTRAEPVLDELERTFRVATTDMAELVIAPTLYRRLAQRAPRVIVHAQITEGVLEPRLRDGEFDLAWMVVFEEVSGLIAQPLYEDRFVCVVSERCELGVRGPLTLGGYVEARHVLISPRGQAGGIVDRALESLGHRREVVALTSSFAAGALLAARADLIVTMPERVALVLVDAGLGVRLLECPLPLPKIRVCMVYHQRYRSDGVHRWFREQVMRSVAAPGGEAALALQTS
jgi:DNA-binding transcriptional LysR family regulator